MTLISNANKRSWRLLIAGLVVFGWVLSSPLTLAQSDDESVSITVAPTMVELSMAPGEIWRSSVKVVNTNDVPLRIYATPAHFAPVGESGQANVVSLADVPADEPLMARWISIDTPAYTIPPGVSQKVPFVITVPETAAPGSHFAAIQISTVPSDSSVSVGLNTAQVISSLLFVRVEGEINEQAHIRSFTSSNSFSVEPYTDLSLRIENDGNVHIQPVGEIIIRNVWGAERGRIPVNYNTSFGNALPDTIREYQFTWQKAPSLFDIGYYTASVSLGYGVQARQFLSAETGFWVIPVQPLLIAVTVIGSIIAFIIFVSRWYITRLLRQAGVTSLTSLQTSTTPRSTLTNRRAAPATNLDLSPRQQTRSRRVWQWLHSHYDRSWALVTRGQQTVVALWQFVPPRQRWVLTAGVLIVVVVCALFLFRDTGRSTDYEAKIGGGANAVTYNAEEITFFQQPGMTADRLATSSTYEVAIINSSNQTGAAGRLAATLVAEFPITTIAPDTDANRSTTVITFPLELQEQAIALSQAIDGALLSAQSGSSSVITVYVGDDQSW